MQLSVAFTRNVSEILIRHHVDRSLADQTAAKLAGFLGVFERLQLLMLFADGPVPPQAEVAAVHATFDACIYCAIEAIAPPAQREEILRVQLTRTGFAEQWTLVGRMIHELHQYLRANGRILAPLESIYKCLSINNLRCAQFFGFALDFS